MISWHFEGIHTRLSVALACLILPRTIAWDVAFERLYPECAAGYAADHRASYERPALLAERNEATARADRAEGELARALAERDALVAERDGALAERDRAAAEKAALETNVRRLEDGNRILRSYVGATR